MSQKRISSYFTPSQVQDNGAKAPQHPSAKALGKRRASVVDLTIDDDDNDAPTSVQKKHKSDDGNPGTSLSKGARQSSFSTKKAGSPICLLTPPPLDTTEHSSGCSSRSIVDKYRFDPSPSKEEPRHDTLERQKKKKLQREALKHRLLDDNSWFSNSLSSEMTRRSAASDAKDVPDENDAEPEQEDERSPLLEDNGKRSFLEIVEKHSNSRSGKAVQDLGPSGKPYTPLESQVRHLKKKYPDVILMVEVGYKYRFFGDDAKVASKELGIVAFKDRNFLTAGIPTHRREVHLKKLLSQGYKVGIIGQLETAALKKVSDNRNAPFERELTHLYTSATYVDELGSADDPALLSPGDAPVLVCISEAPLGGMGTDERVSLGMIAVTPSTGDVIWDDFEDGFMRSELETRMAHIKPSELLLPEEKLSKASEKILSHFARSGPGGSSLRDRTRLERYKGKMKYSEAFQNIQTFYSRQSLTSSEGFNSGMLLAAISNLPHRVSIALAHAIRHLDKFGLADIFTQTEFFTKFTARQHMLLNSNTLSNLEVYRNQTDFSSKGSLMWILNRTRTAFGARLLRSWLGRPLVDISALQERVDAVEEILSAGGTQRRELLMRLRELIKGLPDLSRGLCRMQFGKCTPPELSLLLKAFDTIANTFDQFASPADVGFKSSLLNDIFHSLPSLRDALRSILPCINLKKAEKDLKSELWIDPEKFPSVEDHKMAILMVESELEEELKKIRKILKKPSVQWSEVAGEEYLIEVERKENRPIPENWFLISSTRKVKRFHTPEVKRLLQERAQHQEKLGAESNKAFLEFLTEIIDKFYITFRNSVNKLAIADCLLSLATTASQEGYVKPVFITEDVIEIIDGRHPMVEVLRTDPFVPNSIYIGGDHSKTKVITGPNMGGKSSTVRMVALIALMAQIGSYVPAVSVKMGLVDAILTRMGASDDLAKGRSTFMVEMSETSDILHIATNKSLVILDELGRGSSTFDGMAIAGATLEHLVQNVRCKTLFITHYPLVALSIERKFPKDATNVHMAFSEESRIDGTRTITFLYALVEGISSGSYGVECARLAGLPERLLERATEKAENMQLEVSRKGRINLSKKATEALCKLLNSHTGDFREKQELQRMREIMDILGTMRIH